jgi:N6-adenosine-specific RNA methylase IME4
MSDGRPVSLNQFAGEEKFATVLADPPWRFQNRTGKMAPEHRRLSRYGTMSYQEILELPVPEIVLPQSHLYLWVPNALIDLGLQVMKAWGFQYKTNLVWYKIRKDGGPDGRGVGFYFRNVTELVLFGTRGRMRTLPAGRREVNLFSEHKREHSRKPEQLYDVVERCSPGPYLELFARHHRKKWYQWSDELHATPAEDRPDLYKIPKRVAQPNLLDKAANGRAYKATSALRGD